MWLNGYFYEGSPLYFQRHPICCCLSNCSEKEDQFDNEKDQNEAEENEDVNGEERGENEEEEENTEDINEEDDDEEDRLSGEVSKIKSCYIHTIYTSTFICTHIIICFGQDYQNIKVQTTYND